MKVEIWFNPETEPCPSRLRFMIEKIFHELRDECGHSFSLSINGKEYISVNQLQENKQTLVEETVPRRARPVVSLENN